MGVNENLAIVVRYDPRCGVLGTMVDRLCTCNYDGCVYLLPSYLHGLADPNEHQPSCGYRRYVLGQALLTSKENIS